MHPTEEILLGVASGDSDLPRRVLVEGHLAGCASCRATVAELSAAGGTLLRGIGGLAAAGASDAPGDGAAGRAGAGALPPAAWERLLGRIEGLPQAPRQALVRATFAGPAVPAPTPAAAASPGATFTSPGQPPELPVGVLGELPALAARPRLPWRWARAPGAWYAELARDPWTNSVLLMGYLAPRRFLPAHRHVAQEDVLVLAGGFEDTQGRHEAGEYAIYEAGSTHRPFTEPDEACWCLARLERTNLLLGWRGWLQRLPL